MESTGQSRTPLEPLIAALTVEDPAAREAARAGLLAASMEHLRQVARRMLGRFPQVRRWDETEDIVQNAAIRLHRALATVIPNDARHWMALVATQVRRELLDLARRHNSPTSLARQHETNVVHVDGRDVDKVSSAEAPGGEWIDSLAAWTRLHDIAAGLPDEERELFNLMWYVGATQDEIAALWGCSPRTVRRRWEETKRRVLERFHGEPPQVDE
jgi:RNA polymerase sigma-70 factor (ECF subfamily)